MRNALRAATVVLAFSLAAPALAQFGPRWFTTVNPDRTVTFRLEAPEAASVQVRLANGFHAEELTPLRRDAGGLWTATLGPLAPDLYQYALVVDGVTIADPGNDRPKPERAVRTSLLLVPGNPLVDDRDVPHGTLHEETLNSKVARGPRPLVVYTPPGYESLRELPVLVLYHGAGDTTWSWVRQGQLAQNLDDAIARGTVMPMVVVVAETYPAALLDPDLLARANRRAVDEELMTEVLPFVEGRYRVRADARCQAIAGLSMGGGQALHTALTHPEAFSAVGLFSPAFTDGELPGPEGADKAAPRFTRFDMITGGADVILHMHRRVDAMLTRAGIAHVVRIVENGDHSMFVWRPALRSFAEALTRDRAEGRWCPDSTRRKAGE
jgi:enterochelin esterase family protein